MLRWHTYTRYASTVAGITTAKVQLRDGIHVGGKLISFSSISWFLPLDTVASEEQPGDG